MPSLRPLFTATIFLSTIFLSTTLTLTLLVTSHLAFAQTNAQVAQPQTTQSKAHHPPLVVGPVALNCIDKPCSAATVTANARGSGVNGPATAQTGMSVTIDKDDWWTGGKIGEVDGLDVFVRQNGPHSDSSGILINVQNQGHGFLSATEFASSIVDPVQNVLTYGIDVQEGVLDHINGDYIGAVYTADYGALGTGVLIQNSSPTASWQYALQYAKNGDLLFSVDGLGNIAGNSLYLGDVQLNGDPTNGSADVGNLANASATPYIDLNGFATQNNARMINDANGQLTINTVTGGNLQVNATGVYTTGSFHVNLSTPAGSSSPCIAGQIGADANYIYVCVATNRWKRSALSSF